MKVNLVKGSGSHDTLQLTNKSITWCLLEFTSSVAVTNSIAHGDMRSNHEISISLGLLPSQDSDTVQSQKGAHNSAVSHNINFTWEFSQIHLPLLQYNEALTSTVQIIFTK